MLTTKENKDVIRRTKDVWTVHFQGEIARALQERFRATCLPTPYHVSIPASVVIEHVKSDLAAQGFKDVPVEVKK